MKNLARFLIALSFLALITGGKLFAQDDVYYDPDRDKAVTNTAPAQDEEQPQNEEQTPPAKYDGYNDEANNSNSYRDNEGDTYITNNYYSDYYDDEDYYYSTRLRRFYTPVWGFSYYNYWYTPSYFYGWNSWNYGIYFS